MKLHPLCRINLFCRGDRGKKSLSVTSALQKRGSGPVYRLGKDRRRKGKMWGRGWRPKLMNIIMGGSFILYTIGISQKDQDLISSLAWYCKSKFKKRCVPLCVSLCLLIMHKKENGLPLPYTVCWYFLPTCIYVCTILGLFCWRFNTSWNHLWYSQQN